MQDWETFPHSPELSVSESLTCFLHVKVLKFTAPVSIGTYRHDPRTRLIELLKRWLRTHAANPNITEDEACVNLLGRSSHEDVV